MRVVVGPDKFKGSLTAVEVAAAVTAGLRAVDPNVEVIQVPVADGGDGTVDAAVNAGFHRVAVVASGPTGAPVSTSYARRGDVAVIELASVCGLVLLPDGLSEPDLASRDGLGQVLLAAVEAGARRVVLGIGGSASTDGGAGFLQALGVRITDTTGAAVERGGTALTTVVDVSARPEEFARVQILVASDVDNPLTGPNGAAAVYRPQKGASPTQVAQLDAALAHWADVVRETTGADHATEPGAGAAGGVGFAAVAVLGATLCPGIELMLELIGLTERLAGADLVITGEGSLDAQSLAGKAPVGVADAARATGVPVVAVYGRNQLSMGELQMAGIEAAYALTDLEPDVERCMSEARSLLVQVGSMVGSIVGRSWLSATSD